MSLIMQERDGDTVILGDMGALDITKFDIICGDGLWAKFRIQHFKTHNTTRAGNNAPRQRRPEGGYWRQGKQICSG